MKQFTILSCAKSHSRCFISCVKKKKKRGKIKRQHTTPRRMPNHMIESLFVCVSVASFRWNKSNHIYLLLITFELAPQPAFRQQIEKINHFYMSYIKWYKANAFNYTFSQQLVSVQMKRKTKHIKHSSIYPFVSSIEYIVVLLVYI